MSQAENTTHSGLQDQIHNSADGTANQQPITPISHPQMTAVPDQYLDEGGQGVGVIGLWWRRSWWLRMPGQALMSIIDTVLDCIICALYFQEGETWWGGVEVAILLLSHLSVAIASRQLLSREKVPHATQLSAWALFGVGPIRSVLFDWKAIEADNSQELRGWTSKIRLFESVFESAPQLMLQSYVFMVQRLDGTIRFDEVSTLLAGLSIIWAVFSAAVWLDCAPMRHATPWVQKNSFAMIAVGILDLAARISRFALFGASLRGVVFIVLACEAFVWAPLVYFLKRRVRNGLQNSNSSLSNTVFELFLALFFPAMHAIRVCSMAIDRKSSTNGKFASLRVLFIGMLVLMTIDNLGLSLIMLIIPASPPAENARIATYYVEGVCSLVSNSDSSSNSSGTICFPQEYYVSIATLAAIQAIVGVVALIVFVRYASKKQEEMGHAVYGGSLESIGMHSRAQRQGSFVV